MRNSRTGTAAALTIAFGLTLAACGAGTQTEPPEQAGGGGATVFEGARIIVGDGSTIENGTLVVGDGRITAVGPADQVQVPEGATRVDATGRTIMPAIIDAHTHLSTERDALVEDLERRAYYGVAAAITMGSDGLDAPLGLREETLPNAARYLSAGRGITRPEPGRTEVPHWVNTPEEARAAVREEAQRGVDFIKIWVDDRNGMYEKLTPELYGAVIDEAHMNGLEVAAHIFALEDAKGLLRAGIDAFAHGIRDTQVDDEVIALFRERPDVVLIANLPDRGVVQDFTWLSDSIPAPELQEMQANSTDRPAAQQGFALQAGNLDRLHDAGVRLGMGTDGNTPWAPHQEMADMVTAGVPVEDVLVAATRNNAELLGLTDLGTLEAGKSADFIVLDANPLEDITNTRRINAVYLRGAEVDRDGLRQRWMAPPPATN